jgi:hypothetical protein
MINKKFLIVISLLLLSIATFWLGWQYSQTPMDKMPVFPVITTPLENPADAGNASAPAPLPKPALNLQIPEENFLMDKAVEVPEKENRLESLFQPQPKEKSVTVGGQLILDEKPTEPNAAVWDQVKGAEVGITIETP